MLQSTLLEGAYRALFTISAIALLSACSTGARYKNGPADVSSAQLSDGAVETDASMRADAASSVTDVGVSPDGSSAGPCDNVQDETLIEEDEWSDCSDFADACDNEGTQERWVVRCRGGEATNERQLQACFRDTDGTITDQPDFADCAYVDDCIETGAQTRTNTVCRDGAAVPEEESQECARDTDGTITDQPEFADCSYVDDCIETGTQTRTNTVCRDGAAVPEQESQECARDTDGTITDQPEFD